MEETRADRRIRQAASTQQAYPARAAVRTILANVVAVVITLGVVVPAVVAVFGDGMGAYVPPEVQAWLVGAGAFIAALAGTLTRIMAIPGVDAWLKRLGISSSPEPETGPDQGGGL